jgi:transposase InsO family protein
VQAFVARQRLQLVLQARLHLHQAMTMPHQLPQIALLRRRQGEPRETLGQQQVEQQLGVAAIGLLRARSRRPDLAWMAHPQLDAALGQQPLEPARAPRGLDTHPHRLALRAAVKGLGLAAVLQATLAAFAGGGVTKCDLLKLG